jgi:hypothetical protein
VTATHQHIAAEMAHAQARTPPADLAEALPISTNVAHGTRLS